MNREQRAGLVEVRVQNRVSFRGVDLPKQFTAMPLIYEVVDDYGSIWTKGVFDNARLPILCYGHEGWDQITAVLGKALDYTDRAEGPEYLYEFDDFEIIPTAAQVAHQLDSKTFREFSVGFDRQEWHEIGGSGAGNVGPLSEEDQALGAVERIVSADHWETSVVIAGAVPGTKLLSMRSKDGHRREVPEEFVIDLARKVSAGAITQDEAKVALDLASGEGAGEAGSGDGTGTAPPVVPDPAEIAKQAETAAVSAEADQALETLGLS